MKVKRVKSVLMAAFILVVLVSIFSLTASAADVSGAVQNTWQTARGQIQSVVNNVVFPALTLILAVLFFVKIGAAYFDYRKHGQFEYTAPAILFACLIFTVTAPLYIWSIV